MTPEEQLKIYNMLDDKALTISCSKRHDYADVDTLSNFKSVSAAAAALGIDIGKSTQYAMFMVLLKIARLSNLLNASKDPKNESIEDSFIDAINYMKLAYCCHVDQKNHVES